MKRLGETLPFHRFTNPRRKNRFVFYHGVVVYYLLNLFWNSWKLALGLLASLASKCIISIALKVCIELYFVLPYVKYLPLPFVVNVFSAYKIIAISCLIFQYKLETFTEGRSTKKKKKPYKGGPVDGPENGPPPPPWGIPCQPKCLFRDEKVKIEVPHTAKVKVKKILHESLTEPFHEIL